MLNSERMNRGTILVVIVVSAFSLSACGGDDGSETTSPSEWADSLCTDLSQWRSSIQSVAASFGGGNLSQQQIQNAADDVTSATETLVGNLQTLGTPDTEGGQEAKDALDSLADELQTGIGQVQRAAAGASGAVDTSQAESAIRSTATTMQDELTTAFTSVEQTELKSALEQSDRCRDLSSS
jgi:hypothetical protein